MDANTIDRYQRTVAERLSQLDATLMQIAEESQRAERITLEGGQVAPVHGPRDVVGSAYQQQARDAERDARLDIQIEADRLIESAKDAATEEATETELANISFVLSHDVLSDSELQALYDRSRSKWAIEKVLRSELAKRHLPIDNPNAASVVLERQDDIRARATRAASGRWVNGSGHVTVSPVSVAAATVADAARAQPVDLHTLLGAAR